MEPRFAVVHNTYNDLTEFCPLIDHSLNERVGNMTPRYAGIVVAAIHEKLLCDAIAEHEANTAAMAKQQRRLVVWKNWRRVIHRLIVRQKAAGEW